MDRVRGRPPAVTGGEQTARVRSVLLRHSAYDSESEFLSDVLASLDGESRIEDSALRELIAYMRGQQSGAPGTYDGCDLNSVADAQVWFWRQLAERFGHPLARACHADALLASGKDAEGVALFLEVFEHSPALVYEFGGDLLDVARAHGGESWLSYQLACLRAALAEVGDPAADDYIREIYSELLEEYADEETSLARIRELGRAIEDAERTGKLPRALMRRGRSRRRI